MAGFLFEILALIALGCTMLRRTAAGADIIRPPIFIRTEIESVGEGLAPPVFAPIVGRGPVPRRRQTVK